MSCSDKYLLSIANSSFQWYLLNASTISRFFIQLAYWFTFRKRFVLSGTVLIILNLSKIQMLLEEFWVHLANKPLKTESPLTNHTKYCTCDRFSPKRQEEGVTIVLFTRFGDRSKVVGLEHFCLLFPSGPAPHVFLGIKKEEKQY